MGKINLESRATILAGDVGGTKSNLVLFEIHNGQLTELKKGIYPTKNYKSFVALSNLFLGNKRPPIDGVCLGVAGPVNMGAGYKFSMGNLCGRTPQRTGSYMGNPD